MPRKIRDYKFEYQTYQGKPEQIKNRASRNAARRIEEKNGNVRKGDGKEVDHQDGNPRNNSSSNRKVMSRTANRKKYDKTR